jgi:hypothetical protein
MMYQQFQHCAEFKNGFYKRNIIDSYSFSNIPRCFVNFYWHYKTKNSCNDTNSVKPLETEARLNNIYEFSPYLIKVKQSSPSPRRGGAGGERQSHSYPRH